jgi:hypothetical protein
MLLPDLCGLDRAELDWQPGRQHHGAKRAGRLDYRSAGDVGHASPLVSKTRRFEYLRFEDSKGRRLKSIIDVPPAICGTPD